MKTSNIHDLDKILENEFSNLGFNYWDIIDNGITKLDSQRYQVFGIRYLDMLTFPADGLYLVFTINDVDNGKPHYIESLSAILFSEMNQGKFHELVKKDYLINREPIPTIQQVSNELSQMLKIQTDLQREFARLGFEFVDISRWENLSDTDASNDIKIDRLMLAHHYNDKDNIGYIFIAQKDNESDKWHIDSINADVQLDTERNMEGVIVVSKEYFSRDGPLPHKEQIRNEVLKKVRIENVKERFYLNKKSDNKKRSIRK